MLYYDEGLLIFLRIGRLYVFPLKGLHLFRKIEGCRVSFTPTKDSRDSEGLHSLRFFLDPKDRKRRKKMERIW